MAKAKAEELTEDPKLKRLIRVYLKMKAKRDEISARFDAELESVGDGMEKVKAALLDYCRETGQEGGKTTEGTFYRTTRTTYGTNDWDAMGKFVVEHNVPQILEKRLHQGNIKQFLADNPDLLPPGLNANAQYSVSIVKPRGT